MGSTPTQSNMGMMTQPQTGGSQGASLTPGSSVPAYSTNGQTSQVQYQGQPSGQPQGFGMNGYGNINAVPPAFRSYIQSVNLTQKDGNVQTLPFINSDRIPAALQGTAQSVAAQAGIPYLNNDSANAVLAAQQIIDVVNSAEALSIRNLKPGIGGRVQDSLTNWANNWLQFNPDLSNFGQLKDAASKATTALAGGVGSGFRMNMGIIDAATQNLPTANDNLETALTKAEALRGQILNAIAPIFPQAGGQAIFSSDGSSSSATPAASSSSGSSGSEVSWASLGDANASK